MFYNPLVLNGLPFGVIGHSCYQNHSFSSGKKD